MNKDPNQYLIYDAKQQILLGKGEWILANLTALIHEFKTTNWPKTGELTIDGSGIEKMDTAGAWVLSGELQKLQKQKLKITIKNFSQQQEKLLSIVTTQSVTEKKVPSMHLPGWLVRLGEMVVVQFEEFKRFLAFVGKLSMQGLQVFSNPKRLRWNSIAYTIDITGYRALFIIALLSFMIGVVISYQMGNQLRNYGANVFIVDLLGLSVLREFGPLLTAIMLAGRTGSAFTAQLGIMKINQEVDALNTMGVSPEELLLLPRVIGLVIAMPLLTMWSDIFGIVGGMVMANNMLGITWSEFLTRFQHAIPLRTLIIGLGKTPIFALLIASISCFQGMEVRGSAESVGERTTKSVVISIFFIIIADAIFSVIFSKYNL